MPKRTSTRLTKRTVEQTHSGEYLWDSEVPGFGVRLLPSGSKRFVFQFRTIGGEQGRLTIGRFPSMTVDQARRIARECRTEVDRGGNPSLGRREERAAPSLRDLANHYCDEYAIERALKPRTIKDARRLLGRYALPRLGRRKVRDITPADIRKVVSEAREGSGRYEANRLRAVLSRMFTLAIQQNLRASNPCNGVERYREDQRWKYLPEEHVWALLAACDRYGDQNAADAIRLLLFTGARLQEVLKASWDQFDLEAGTWEKPSHHTKTKIRHRVPLSKSALRLLRRMRAEDFERVFLFPGRKLETPRADLNRPWKAICEAAGLNGYRLHDLRRTTATFLLSDGTPLATVGKVLGHTQASTTARYAHLFQDAMQDGLDKAGERMERGKIDVCPAIRLNRGGDGHDLREEEVLENSAM